MVITRRQVKAALTIGLLFAIMMILPRESTPVPAAALMPSHTAVLLDPGHGTPDGGALAPDGTMMMIVAQGSDQMTAVDLADTGDGCRFSTCNGLLQQSIFRNCF